MVGCVLEVGVTRLLASGEEVSAPLASVTFFGVELKRICFGLFIVGGTSPCSSRSRESGAVSFSWGA